MLLAVLALLAWRSGEGTGIAGAVSIGCGLGAVLAAIAFASGATAAVPLGFGAIGAPAVLFLDRLGAAFLLLLFLAGWAMARMRPDAAASTALAVSASGTPMLCGNGIALALLLPLAVLALHRLARRPPPVLPLAIGTALLVLPLAAAATLDGGLQGDGFAALRDAASGGTAGGATLLSGLLLLGAWQVLPRRPAILPAWMVVSGVLLAQFTLLRLALDLEAAWLARPALGALLAVGGASWSLRAAATGFRATELRDVVRALVLAPGGLAALAIGAELILRGLDLPGLAMLGGGAALALVGAQVLAGTVLLGLADRVVAETGSGDLGRLGGVGRSMPRAALLGGLAAGCLGGVPGFAVFGAAWMAFQALLGAARFSGQSWLLLGTAAAVLLGIAALGVAALAWCRLAILVVAGRPRTPRAAAALDLDRSAAWTAAPALLPALLLGPLAGWLPRLVLAPGLPSSETGGWVVAAPGSAAAYAALPLLVVLGAASVATQRAVRRVAGPVSEVPPWRDGMADDPPWLPFGDPLLQPGPRGLGRVVIAELGWPTVPAARARHRLLRLGVRARRAWRRTGAALCSAAGAGPRALAAVAALAMLAAWWGLNR